MTTSQRLTSFVPGRIDKPAALKAVVQAIETGGLPVPAAIEFQLTKYGEQLTLKLRTFSEFHAWRRECATDDLRQQTDAGFDWAYAGADWLGVPVLLIAAQPVRTDWDDKLDAAFGPLSNEQFAAQAEALALVAGGGRR